MRKHNFKNLPFSLAKRRQFFECANFGDSKENSNAHPLFSSVKEFGMLNIANNSMLRQLRGDFDKFGLLPGIEVQNSYKTTFNAFDDAPLPAFGKI